MPTFLFDGGDVVMNRDGEMARDGAMDRAMVMDRDEYAGAMGTVGGREADPGNRARRPRHRAPSTWRWSTVPGRVHTAHPVDDPWTSLERDLETLADILPLLVVRVDERPATWQAPAFARQVAFVRSRIVAIANGRLLSARLGPEPPGPGSGRFERATRRLATDATAVALAIRWLEIADETRLPSWAEILRRRSIGTPPVVSRNADASIWFG
jgi:hypothetical protein